MAVIWLLLPGSAVAASSAAATSPVSVFPSPGSLFGTAQTQISFRGIAPAALGRIVVTGSSSGVHTGRFKPDSDRHGVSFYPTHQFIPGETVTVRTGLPILDAHDGTFTFGIADLADPVPQPVRLPVPRTPGDVRKFHSRPDLRPTAVRITQPHAGSADIFLTPMHGPLQWGPMIVDRRGSVVWFKPIPGPRTIAADFNVQEYRGHPVLTWWQGFQNYGGLGPNEDVIVNRRYRRIATVRAGNGLTADIHEFNITPQGTALITAYRGVHWNGSPTGRDELVANCYVQEIDIPTGNVLFQWDSLDHIPPADSYLDSTLLAPYYDYFHINSVAQDTDGNLIISARNTWAIYKVDRRTGNVLWELGGKHSSFEMGPGTRTAYQHDARIHPGGEITTLDNAPGVHAQSRVVVERISTRRHTATLIRELDHSPSLLTPWEGSAQVLPDGDTFVGWGGLPYFTEFDRMGRQIFDGRFVGGSSSYRAYEHPWSGQPATRPAIAVTRSAAGATTIYASWNGATDVSRWRVLAARTRRSLVPVAVAQRRGFETSLTVHTDKAYFAVQAIGASGRVLAESRIRRTRG